MKYIEAEVEITLRTKVYIQRATDDLKADEMIRQKVDERIHNDEDLCKIKVLNKSMGDTLK